jgi:hypothetical protein
MKYRIGDLVRFLNETGGGKITRMDEKGYYYVLSDDGFEIPVRANELILQTSFSGNAEPEVPAESEPKQWEKEQQPVQKSSRLSGLTDDRIPFGLPAGTPVTLLLGFVPDDSQAVFKASIHIFLINDSEFFLYYKVGYQQQGKYFYLKSGEIEPNTKCFLADFDQVNLGKISLFHIQALPVSAGQYFRVPLIDEEIDISRYDFMKSHIYKANDYFDDSALILCDVLNTRQKQSKINESTIDDKNTGSTMHREETKPRSGGSDTLEIDLHIEALRDDYSGLSNSEIMRIQMNCFRSTLEEALSNKVKRIVFIHGIGNGTLKLEIRNELKRNYPEFTYQDASFKEYGFGATMVHLR